MPAIRSTQPNALYRPTLFRPSSRPFRAARLRGHPWYRDYQPQPPSKLAMSFLASELDGSEPLLSELGANTDDTNSDSDANTDADTDTNSLFSTPSQHTHRLTHMYDTSPVLYPPTSPSISHTFADSNDAMSLVTNTPSRGSFIAQAPTQPATPSTPTPLRYSRDGLRRTYAMVISPLPANNAEPMDPSMPPSLFSNIIPDEENNTLLGTSISNIILYALIIDQTSTDS